MKPERMRGQVPDGPILEGSARPAEEIAHILNHAPRPVAGAIRRPAGALVVTGASGWIGARLARLARERGVAVAALGRHAWLGADAAPARPNERAGPVDPCALGGADGLDGLAGAAIVHLAAIAHRPAGSTGAAEFDRVNRDGAVRFARRAKAAGATRFVFASTAAVMPPGNPRAWTEADAPAPRDAYARAKLAAERELWALHEPGRFEVVVLRPPLVYGPGARANFGRLLALAATGWPLPLAGATAPRSMVYLDNLVDALLHAAAAPAAAGRTFFVGDGTERSVADWIGAVRAALGRPPRLFALPMPLVRLAARVAGRQAAYERLFLPMRVDGSALRATGWRPPVGPDAALAATVAAWRAGAIG